MKLSPRRSRRHRNPKKSEQKEHKPFFSKANDTSIQTKEENAFFQPKLAIGQPGDKYEQEADAMADAVVNKTGNTNIQQKQGDQIQRVTLASPEKDEKLGTAEQRMEEDKMIQEKPELQLQEEEEEMAQMQAEEEEEPVQMQAEEEEEPVQMQAEEEEEPVQMQAEEEEEPVQMQAEEEEEPVQMQAEEEEEPIQMQAEEEEEVQTKKDPSQSRSASNSLSSKINQKKGKGNPLTKQTRAEMEQAFGVGFSGVNIHTDREAVQMNKELGAQAFTHGKDVYFNSGKYRPETSSGKHLLAHELTHVVQQGEANKNFHSPGSTTISKKPETLKEKLDRIEKTYLAMIAAARAKGHNVAADNLDRFLKGTGGVKKISVSWLRGFSAVTSAEEVNQERFEKSLKEKAYKLNDGQSSSLSDYWDRKLTASVFAELYYASGTSTIKSKGSFQLSRSGKKITITGKVDHHWYDPYDWHAGLGAYIPGFGSISDADALLMQTHRGAKPFKMEADWSQSLSGSVVIVDYWFDKVSLKWTGP